MTSTRTARAMTWILPMLLAAAAEGQILRAAEMTSDELAALDRSRTAVLLVGGILEQHGPYLPAFTDGYRNEWVADRLAEAIVAKPGWSVLVFPTIPLGTGGANEIGRRYVFSGTYAVRSATLRSLFMDLGDELGEQGFRLIFVLHGHGAPNHNRTLDEAGDYFRDTYGGRMVHLLGLMEARNRPNPLLTESIERQEGFSPHAGVDETSLMLFLKPSLVAPTHRTAKSIRGEDWAELVALAKEPGWPGYFGAPKLATAAIGAAEANAQAAGVIEIALAILEGADERDLVRFSDFIRRSEVNNRIDRDALEREERRRRRQETWLASRAEQE